MHLAVSPCCSCSGEPANQPWNLPQQAGAGGAGTRGAHKGRGRAWPAASGGGMGSGPYLMPRDRCPDIPSRLPSPVAHGLSPRRRGTGAVWRAAGTGQRWSAGPWSQTKRRSYRSCSRRVGGAQPPSAGQSSQPASLLGRSAAGGLQVAAAAVRIPLNTLQPAPPACSAAGRDGQPVQGAGALQTGRQAQERS